MNTRFFRTIAGSLAFVPAMLYAGPRTSASYTIPTEIADAAGKRSASASYANEGSAGGITGVSTAAPSHTVIAGFIAQLVNAGLTIFAANTNVAETSTVQLSASLTLEDGTETVVTAADVAWSVHSGPITGISPGGLATADIVYQNTGATVRGTYNGQPGLLGLTVMDTFPDNFGSYAGDGLADSWQAQYFGLTNPAAAPALDPDGDGQINFFEFTAGVIPTDPQSRFRLRLESVAGQPGQTNVIFSPIVAGRTYTVEFTTSLTAGSWAPLPGATQSDNRSERTVTDPGAAAPRRFYRVEVEKP